jgi:peptide-methionine (S)-S-oxide reductase
MEAIFQTVRGVVQVDSGFASPLDDKDNLSEAVWVQFEPTKVSLDNLIAIHLHTHKSTSAHTRRDKYRSAIYVTDTHQKTTAAHSLMKHQRDFKEKLVTQVVLLGAFTLSDPRYHNYYAQDPQRPFCQTYIAPKLQTLRQRFSEYTQE